LQTSRQHSAWQPVAAADLPRILADALLDLPGRVRVAVDGPPCADPSTLAASLADLLRTRGRAAVHVRADLFWRDASLRLEHGRQDVTSYPSWLDADALRREVLDAGKAYLPSLRDPSTNRSTRELQRPLPEDAVVLVSGGFLLARGLPFERTVHLAVSPAARARRTPGEDAWTLPAFDDYDETALGADVVIKLDDPRRPALRQASESS